MATQRDYERGLWERSYAHLRASEDRELLDGVEELSGPEYERYARALAHVLAIIGRHARRPARRGES